MMTIGYNIQSFDGYKGEDNNEDKFQCNKTKRTYHQSILKKKTKI